jgi:curli biogenesis system outer membrane secretion channel CsgG
MATAVALPGCRYGFSGGGLPRSVKTVAILPFENETASAELPRELTDALREAAEKRLGLRAAAEEKADAVLRGKIVQYEPDVAVAVSADRRQSTSARRRVRIALDVELVDQSTGKVIWQKTGVSGDGEYAEGGEASGRKLAIDRIVADIIEGAQSQW